jgi:hypothetical protein
MSTRRAPAARYCAARSRAGELPGAVDHRIDIDLRVVTRQPAPQDRPTRSSHAVYRDLLHLVSIASVPDTEAYAREFSSP